MKLCRIVYDKKLDCYDLEISLDGGETWGLNIRCEFVTSQEHLSSGKSFLHYGIVKELTICAQCGYTLTGMITR